MTYEIIYYVRCKNISYLSLCYCEQIQEDGIDLIGSIENLISIDLSGCKCGDHVCIHINILIIFENRCINFFVILSYLKES